MKTLATLAVPFLLSASFAVPAVAQGGGGLYPYLQSLPIEAVDANEVFVLQHMREEEKLARDVYLVLHQTWQVPMFANIAQSEQSHMDLVAWALTRYQIADPVPSDTVGVFGTAEYTSLFQFATTLGQISPAHALLVGALIEDLDIVDLGASLGWSDNRDLDCIWQNLQRGSRNHLRAFYPQLASAGYVYPAFFLTPTELLAIVTTPTEPRPVDENGVPLF